MIRKPLTTLVIAATVCGAGVSAAQASFSGEMKAATKVEQAATRHWRGFDVTAVCDQQSRHYFWCEFAGEKGSSCFLTGHAKVWHGSYGWRVRIVSGNKDCF